MLVLSRKTKEQIMIGDDVRITLLRIEGNKVRIGIDAPKHIRVVRGELEKKDRPNAPLVAETKACSDQISRREEAFAHPPVEAKRGVGQQAMAPIRLATESSSPRRAPLSDYMTAI